VIFVPVFKCSAAKGKALPVIAIFSDRDPFRCFTASPGLHASIVWISTES
jgi:hypothetical protein